jgi:hypothetical protein
LLPRSTTRPESATMSADVVEVDFEARRLAKMPLDERADELWKRTGELQVLVENEVSWLERQWKAERRRCSELQKALLRERPPASHSMTTRFSPRFAASSAERLSRQRRSRRRSMVVRQRTVPACESDLRSTVSGRPERSRPPCRRRAARRHAGLPSRSTMPSVRLERRTTKAGGARFRVQYRVGGRESRGPGTRARSPRSGRRSSARRG